jgi:hypothetical protein
VKGGVATSESGSAGSTERPRSSFLQFIGRSASKTVTTPPPTALHTAHPIKSTRYYFGPPHSVHTFHGNFRSYARSQRRCLRSRTAICTQHLLPGTLATATDNFYRSRMWRVLRNTKQMCADRVCASLQFSQASTII